MDSVDVAGWREPADVADVVVAAANRIEVGVKQLFVLDALDHAEHTPRQVIVDARHLPGPPDQGNDREQAAGLDVQSMTAVAVWRPSSLLGGQHADVGKVLTQLLGDELRCVRAADGRGDGRAYAVEKFAQFENGSSQCRCHALSVRPVDS